MQAPAFQFNAPQPTTQAQPTFPAAQPAQAQVAFGNPAPAPAGGYGSDPFDVFATAQVTNSSPPKPGFGDYGCRLLNVIFHQQKALIFEYEIVEAGPGAESPVGMKSSIYRETVDPKYAGYTNKVILAIMGCEPNPGTNAAQIAQYTPLIPAVIRAAVTKQTMQSVAGPIPPEALIGRPFRLSVRHSSKGPNAKGKTYNDETVSVY